MSAFSDILTAYFFINLSSSSSKEYAMCIALKIATGEILQIFKKSPTRFCFTTSKECSGQISQKSAGFWYPINSFVWLNDARSFSQSFFQFSFEELKKLAIHIFSRNLHLLSFPTRYSLPCFPLKWHAYEFFSRRTPTKVRSNLKERFHKLSRLDEMLMISNYDVQLADLAWPAEIDWVKCRYKESN